MASVEPTRSRESYSPRGSVDRSTTVRHDSPSTASSRTFGVAINGEAEIREAHRRNMDESLDTATSFKYMMDIGAHVNSRKPDVPEAIPDDDESPEVVQPTAMLHRGRSPRAGKSAIKKPPADNVSTDTQQPPQANEEAQTLRQENTTPKGKRKVTFDVQPEVAIIATAASVSKSRKGSRPEGELRTLFASNCIFIPFMFQRLCSIWRMRSHKILLTVLSRLRRNLQSQRVPFLTRLNMLAKDHAAQSS